MTTVRHGLRGVSGGLTSTVTVGRLLRAQAASAAGRHGDVAQLGERCLRTAEVGGSNPLVSTRNKRRPLESLREVSQGALT